MDAEDSDVVLSCGSSSFDDDEDYMVNYDEITEDEKEDQSNIEDVQPGIHPYQFEPYASGSGSDDDEQGGDGDENNIERLENTSWCSCQHCQIMPSARECVCCKEIEKVQVTVTALPNIQCITEHPGFQTVCLDPYVLEVAYSQYNQQYGESIDDGNERKRYTAYRLFVRWNWGYLGKHVRVVLPSCGIIKIRNTYPDQNQSYTGFQEYDN